jgi:hypothetical protein
MNLTSSVLHRYAYITPPQLAQKIRQMRVVCQIKPFLECCVEYNDIQSACKKFSDLYQDDTLADPYVFEQRVNDLNDEIERKKIAMCFLHEMLINHKAKSMQ